MSGSHGNFVKPAVAAAHFGVDPVTLRRWAAAGVLRYIRVTGPKGDGHRRYDISSVHSGDSEPEGAEEAKAVAAREIKRSKEPKRLRIGYCRVSSIKQRDDLDRQVAELRSLQPPLDEIVNDIGSGLNYKRKNFQRLLARVAEGGIENITVAYRDRLCRFGHELVEYILELHDCNLTVLHEVHEVSDEQELARDLMDIVHVFSSRRNGRRRYRPAAKEAGADSGNSSPTSNPEAKGEVPVPVEAGNS